MATMTKFGLGWRTLTAGVEGNRPRTKPEHGRRPSAHFKARSKARSKGVPTPVISPAVASRLRRDLQSAGFTRAEIKLPRGTSLWIPDAPLLWFGDESDAEVELEGLLEFSEKDEDRDDVYDVTSALYWLETKPLCYTVEEGRWLWSHTFSHFQQEQSRVGSGRVGQGRETLFDVAYEDGFGSSALTINEFCVAPGVFLYVLEGCETFDEQGPHLLAVGLSRLGGGAALREAFAARLLKSNGAPLQFDFLNGSLPTTFLSCLDADFLAPLLMEAFDQADEVGEIWEELGEGLADEWGEGAQGAREAYEGRYEQGFDVLFAADPFVGDAMQIEAACMSLEQQIGARQSEREVLRAEADAELAAQACHAPLAALIEELHQAAQQRYDSAPKGFPSGYAYRSRLEQQLAAAPAAAAQTLLADGVMSAQEWARRQELEAQLTQWQEEDDLDAARREWLAQRKTDEGEENIAQWRRAWAALADFEARAEQAGLCTVQASRLHLIRTWLEDADG